MGVKGLQSFVERCCPEACVSVNLREMAAQHVARSNQDRAASPNTTGPIIAVDGMACLRHWYSCKDWVCGGQWREYMDVLRSWVGAFTSAGIRLVFFFDGLVKEQKRAEWVKRRRRVKGEISKIFLYMKARGQQPGRELFCLPSGLATFTSFALRSLGQEVFSSIQEADYEIASYACQHNCMGILGQDSDFIIYDSAPYLSVAKLQIGSLTTVLYDRRRFCRSVGLTVAQLPLLACLLGNDVVSEEWMQNIRNEATAAYRRNKPAPHPGVSQGQMVLAVSHLVSSVWDGQEREKGLIPQSLNLSAFQREILKKGICCYLLPGQEALQRGDIPALPSTPAFEKYVSPDILKACREKHVAGEGFMVYSVLCEGVTECSNTLEDEEDTELIPQALVYKRCRQLIYGLLLLHGHDGSNADLPAVKEWFVYPGNPLQEADVVRPLLAGLPCDIPSLDLLWFSSGPEVSALRLTSFLSIFDCLDFSELRGAIEDSLLAALCLVTYTVLQVQTLSEEDVDAYLSQAVCLRLKSPQELQQIKLPFISSRAVQLGSLYVRGLSHLLGANCASGCPLPSAALMPWHSFDGRLFHSKYLLAHNDTEKTVLLDNSPSCLSLFVCLREKLMEACRKRGRILHSGRKAAEKSHKPTAGHSDQATGDGERWREMEMAETTRDNKRQDQSQFRDRRWEGGGGLRGSHLFHSQPHFYNDGGPPKQSRRRPHCTGGRYRLAPRWSQPPPPGM
ncbi:constitutive coactivator of peroxisome proliferator-activated receptor gamma-like [Brachionichthys hirsutus]|uniref:constitutive coactivator of peroxisome proliferator-activated receptor gamma-like n=1 Tax=Brachionichthys hirsutus TaxID=412623 RepID=UPI003604973F